MSKIKQEVKFPILPGSWLKAQIFNLCIYYHCLLSRKFYILIVLSWKSNKWKSLLFSNMDLLYELKKNILDYVNKCTFKKQNEILSYINVASKTENFVITNPYPILFLCYSIARLLKQMLLEFFAPQRCS